MLSMCTLNAGQAENYYDKDDLYHAQEGQEVDQAGRIADTARFDGEAGLLLDEHITKEEYKGMIQENERFRQVSMTVKPSAELLDQLRENPEQREQYNAAVVETIQAEAQRAGVTLNEKKFTRNRDGVVTGSLSHNIQTAQTAAALHRLDLGRIAQGIAARTGQDPAAVQVKAKQERGRIGVDMTFSVPKSVSLMRYASEGHREAIEAAHKAALGNVLKHINDEYGQARIQVNGNQEMIRGNMEAFVFHHQQSRANDPDYHSHVNIAIRMKCEDGNIRSLQPHDIFKDQKAIGRLYRQELSRELNMRGIQTTATDQRQHFFEVKGVPQELIREASSRRQEIVNEWDRRGLEGGDKRGKEAAALETRPTKKDHDLSEIEAAWGPRVQALNIPLNAPQAVEIKSPDQVIQAIEKNTYHFTEREFLHKYKEHEPAAQIADIKAEFKRRCESGHIFETERNGQKYFATAGTLDTERQMIAGVQKGRGASWNLSPDAVHSVDLSGLKEGQRAAIVDTLQTRNQFHAIEGDAGSGKTYMLGYMRQVCEAQGVEIRGMAPSNTAVEGMRDESGIKSETVHKFLGDLERESYKAQGRVLEKPEGIKQEWDFSLVQKAPRPELWVVDESSMLDNRIARQITQAAEARGAKVVLIGDRKQKQAVGPGNAQAILINGGHVACTRMSEVMRQKDKWHVYQAGRLSPGQLEGLKAAAKEANAVLRTHKGAAPLSAIQRTERATVRGHEVLVDSRLRRAVDNLAAGGALRDSMELLRDQTKEIGKRSARLQEMSRDFLKTYRAGSINTLALVATNADRANLNYKIRQALKDAGALQDGVKVRVEGAKGGKKAGEIEISPGDRLMSLGKHAPSGAQNGTFWIVKDITKDGRFLTIQKPGNHASYRVDLQEFNKFTHAYAVTSYKSQGMSIDHVYINMDTAQKNSAYRDEAYVCASRAKENAHIYTNDQAGAGQLFDRSRTQFQAADFHQVKGPDPFQDIPDLRPKSRPDPFGPDVDAFIREHYPELEKAEVAQKATAAEIEEKQKQEEKTASKMSF